MKIVKIKTWERMEEQYGLNSNGNILTYYTFTPSMERQMPKNRIITIDEGSNWDGWSIDEDMIDSVIHKGVMTIRVKTWKTMEREFGLDVRGDIASPIPFMREMEACIPEDRFVEVIADRNHYKMTDKENPYYIDRVCVISKTQETENEGC